MKITFCQTLCICSLLLLGSGCALQLKGDSTCSQEETYSVAPNRKQKEIYRFRIVQKGKWGYIDGTGKIVVEPKYSELRGLSSQRSRFKQGNKWGILDDQYGREIIEAKFEMLSYAQDGRAPFKHEGKWGLIDLNGQVILEPSYAKIKTINRIVSSQRFLFLQGGKWGLIDLNGQVILEPSSEEIILVGSERLSFLQGGKWGLIDANGQVILEPSYEKIKAVGSQSLSFLQNGKWGLIDAKRSSNSGTLL